MIGTASNYGQRNLSCIRSSHKVIFEWRRRHYPLPIAIAIAMANYVLQSHTHPYPCHYHTHPHFQRRGGVTAAVKQMAKANDVDDRNESVGSRLLEICR